jgi:hypothetical protein
LQYIPLRPELAEFPPPLLRHLPPNPPPSHPLDPLAPPPTSPQPFVPSPTLITPTPCRRPLYHCSAPGTAFYLAFATLQPERRGPLLFVETEVNEGSSVQMKGVLFYGWFVGLVMPVQDTFYPVLAALFSSVAHLTFFQFICTHHQATWPGSLAGPPVSVCVSLVATNYIFNLFFALKIYERNILLSRFSCRLLSFRSTIRSVLFPSCS